MNSLSHILLSVPEPEALVNDLAAAVETHIARLGGLSGLALRTGYGALRAAKPDIARRAVRRLLPVAALALEPLYAESRNRKDLAFGAYLEQHRERASTLILAAIETYIENDPSGSGAVIYKKFRGPAASELNKLLPPLGHILGTHIA